MSFREINSGGVIFLRSCLLDDRPGITHGFSTRYGGVSTGIFSSLNLGHARGDNIEAVEENYRRFCGAVGADVMKMVFSHQVHRDNVRTVTAADAGKGLWRERGYEADALITDVPGIPLVIFSADCLPVLLYDPVRKVIGACHCGWRGTSLGLAGKTARAMQVRFGCSTNDIHAAIGPGISACCFETDVDVPEAMLAHYGEKASDAIRGPENGKYHVDCKMLNRLSLTDAGVPEEQIDVTTECTCCQPEKYWSHRRVGQNRGSLAAVIQLLD